MKEQWRDIPDYEGVYQVSDRGRVMRVRAAQGTQKGLILRQCNLRGYKQVGLTKCSKRENFLVHRLVAEAFLGLAPGLEVNHLNGVKHDNRLANLEWATSSQNHLHRVHVLGQKLPAGEDCPASKLAANQVREIRRRSKAGERGSAIAKDFPVGGNAIYLILNGKNWASLE